MFYAFAAVKMDVENLVVTQFFLASYATHWLVVISYFSTARKYSIAQGTFRCHICVVVVAGRGNVISFCNIVGVVVQVPIP